MAFRKIMLLDYSPAPFQALNQDGWGYELTVKVSTWWGLCVRIKTFQATVPMNVSADEFYSPKLRKWIKNPKRSRR